MAKASVTVDGVMAGRCGKGLLLLVAAHREDTEQNSKRLAEKASTLRIFNDEAGKMNLALGDLPSQQEPQILAISNFTVYGDASKQRRPSFMDAAPYADGERLFNSFVQALRDLGLSVETGVFGAHMDVELVNDGPVTLILEA